MKTNLIFLCTSNYIEEEIDVASIHAGETFKHYDLGWKHDQKQSSPVKCNRINMSHDKQYIQILLWQCI